MLGMLAHVRCVLVHCQSKRGPKGAALRAVRGNSIVLNTALKGQRRLVGELPWATGTRFLEDPPLMVAYTGPRPTEEHMKNLKFAVAALRELPCNGVLPAVMVLLARARPDKHGPRRRRAMCLRIRKAHRQLTTVFPAAVAAALCSVLAVLPDIKLARSALIHQFFLRWSQGRRTKEGACCAAVAVLACSVEDTPVRADAADTVCAGAEDTSD
eukprot:gene3991-2050_t